MAHTIKIFQMLLNCEIAHKFATEASKTIYRYKRRNRRIWTQIESRPRIGFLITKRK